MLQSPRKQKPRPQPSGVSEPAPARTRSHDWLIIPLIYCVVLISYAPAMTGGLVWDDDAHVTKPELRTLHGLGRIWFDLGATQQYYPVTHSLFWLEHALWGDSVLGYHLVNITLHATCACLVWVLLRRLEIPGAILAALVFALHPVHVESVAWISELKNTLSGTFYLSAALVYLGFDRRRSLRLYLLAMGLFVLGLLSKTVTATLPAALLVIFWWERGRLSWRRDVLPLTPWFALGAIAGAFTAWVERTLIGASGAEYAMSIVQRCLLAGRAICFYLGKLIWPAELIFIYPRWELSASAIWQFLFPAGVIILLVALWTFRRQHRGPLAALLFFIGTLFPALGFLNVYPFIFSFVADHFQYLASLGIITLASAGVTLGLARLSPRPRAFGQAGCIVVLLALALLTMQQSRQYSDLEKLYRVTIAKNPSCWMPYYNLGKFLVDGNRPKEAIPLLEKGRGLAASSEDLAMVNCNLGTALANVGRTQEAILSDREALRLKPRYPLALYNLGNALAKVGQPAEAISAYEAALKLDPQSAETHNNLATVLLASGQTESAITHYREAIRLKPADAGAWYNLGNALVQLGRMKEAISSYEQALRLAPNFAEAHRFLAAAYAATGQSGPAIEHYRQALRLNPDDAVSCNNLAWIYATDGDPRYRNPAEAAKLAGHAAELTQRKDAGILDTLAVAYGAVGRIDEGIAAAEQAIALARSGGQEELAKSAETHLAGLRRQKANRPPTTSP